MPTSGEQPPTGTTFTTSAKELEKIQTGTDEKPQTKAQKAMNTLCLLAVVAKIKQARHKEAKAQRTIEF